MSTLTEPRQLVSDDEGINSSGESSQPSSLVKTEPPLTSQPKIRKTEDDAMPLPDPFPLPKHYPHDLQSALQTKMSVKDKQRFVSKIASAMLKTIPRMMITFVLRESSTPSSKRLIKNCN